MDHAGKYIFKIFVNGVSPEQSVTALTNLLELCRRHLPPGYEVQPIDVNVHPKLVQQYGVTVVPTTIRESPEPSLRATGDLSDPQAALQALGMPAAPTPVDATHPDVPRPGRP